MKRDSLKKELMKYLVERFDSIILTREQAAKALDISVQQLDRRKRQALPPRYLKSGSANSKVQYLISDIVDYLISSRVKAI